MGASTTPRPADGVFKNEFLIMGPGGSWWTTLLPWDPLPTLSGAEDLLRRLLVHWLPCGALSEEAKCRYYRIHAITPVGGSQQQPTNQATRLFSLLCTY